MATWLAMQVMGVSEIITFRERLSKVLPFTLFHAASLASANFALTYMYPSYHAPWRQKFCDDFFLRMESIPKMKSCSTTRHPLKILLIPFDSQFSTLASSKHQLGRG